MKNISLGRTCVVIPAYNEAGKIGRVVRGIRKYWKPMRILVVDDGSSDGTQAEAGRAGATVLRHPRNRGVGAALRTGFEKAGAIGADAVIVMGGDDQDRSQEFPRFIRKLNEGYDFVQGSRWLALGRVVNIPMFRRVTTIVYSILFTLLTARKITDGTNGFRAFRTHVLRGINLNRRWLDTYELEPYLYYRAIVDDFRVAEVPVTKRYPRSEKGYTKMIPFRDWWRILKPLILLGTGIRR